MFQLLVDAKRAEAAEIYTNHIKDNGNKYLQFIEHKGESSVGVRLNEIMIKL